jgi:hypothetical protein
MCDLTQGRGSIPRREDGREVDTAGLVCLEDTCKVRRSMAGSKRLCSGTVYTRPARKSPEEKEGKDRRKDFEAHRLGHGGERSVTASDSPENL